MRFLALTGWILISAVLPAHDEQELVAYLRTTAELAHQQTLMIPRLASLTDDATSGKRSFFKRSFNFGVTK